MTDVGWVNHQINREWDDERSDAAYLLELLVGPAWMGRAACKGLTDLMFQEGRGDSAVTQEAKQVCQGCPVLSECHEYALRLPESVSGVWAGMSQRGRRDARQARRMTA